MMSPRVRTAGSDDAEGIALLHTASWRRHYRGAYADSYLDGDLLADRRSVWSARLAVPTNTMTAVAEDHAGLVGFVHVAFDDDDRWGTLIDNLHVVQDRRRTGIGTTLLTHAAESVARSARSRAVYLWVLEHNVAAQRFYRTLGGACAERTMVAAPGGLMSNLNGTPAKLRMVWPDVASLARDESVSA
jgi:ribosomal protein S18 acetylase RimI-like enzyme